MAALAALAAGCKDPVPPNTQPVTSSSGPTPITINEDCPAGDGWLPMDGGATPPPPMVTPPPHPDTECAFYRGAYQNFLIATAPLANGDPNLVNYATIDDAFVSSYNTNHRRNTGDSSADPYGPGGVAGATAARLGPATGKAWLGAVHQAGGRQIVVDQGHHTLYYGLHMNQAFVDFVKANHLDTISGDDAGVGGILHVDPNLQFPPGVAEFKSAWADIDPRDFPDATGNYGNPNATVPPPTDFTSDPGDYSNYITTMAWVPWLTQDPTTHAISEDPEHPVLRRVALVAIHCVYTLPGHPEFIWGSVQHVNLKEIDPAPLAFAGVTVYGMPDSQPNATGPDGGAVLVNPNDPSTDPSNVMLPPDSTHSYLLYKAGTPESAANVPLSDSQLILNEATQTFMGTPTSVFRVFPGSKADQLAPDSAIFSLNSNLNTLFGIAVDAGVMNPSIDKRLNYRLVAAVWMDKPDLFVLGTKQADGTYLGASLQNDDPASPNPLVSAAGFFPAGTPGTASMDPASSTISQGVSCGTPLPPKPLSGDAPGATGYNNTVPGCDTRADQLALPTALHPEFYDDGGRINPLQDFQNHVQGTDSPFSILGGEDRLSSTSMETFTQNNNFHNCFSCHNTQPINANGVSQDPSCIASTSANPLPGCLSFTTIPFGAKINVSHMFSEYILGEQAAAARHANGN